LTDDQLADPVYVRAYIEGCNESFAAATEELQKLRSQVSARELPPGYSVKHVDGHGWVITPPDGSKWIAFENTPAGNFLHDLMQSNVSQVSAQDAQTNFPKDMSEARRIIVQLRGRLDDLKVSAQEVRDSVLDEAQSACMRAVASKGAVNVIGVAAHCAACGDAIEALKSAPSSKQDTQYGAGENKPLEAFSYANTVVEKGLMTAMPQAQKGDRP
jgi:hypothetical protein